MRNAWFIAWHDLRTQLRQGETLLWLLVMPPIFFWFIGTVTAGFSASVGGGSATPLTVVAEAPGFLEPQLDRRLRESEFAPDWRQAPVVPAGEEAAPLRTLTFPDRLTERVQDGERVPVSFETAASSLAREVEIIRIRRSLYTALADIAVADARDAAPLTAAALETLNAAPRAWSLEVSPAGERREIPSGFEQAVPGILVMFTLLVLLTSGAAMLTVERLQGLLRRLASAPLSRAEIVGGKWVARMGLAAVQVGAALVVGTFLFRMHWGPDPAMVLLVLAAWAAFCASAGLLLGTLARTENQAAGLGALLTNLLAALGGCWWPIEITPEWMQWLQKLLPTGWTMDALHRLVSFEAGAAAALPHVVTLLLAALVVARLAVRRFRFG